MKCPKCGADCADDARFCLVCGEMLNQNQQTSDQNGQNVKYCPKCGNPYGGNPAFCPSCGTPLQEPNVAGAYGSNGATPPPRPGRVSPRSIPLYIILSIVTCGIFAIYWLVCLVNDLNTTAGTFNDTTGGVVLVLTIVTCGIYGIYWMYKAGEKVSLIKARRGQPTGNDAILYLILQLLGFGIINYCLIQNEINQTVTAQR